MPRAFAQIAFTPEVRALQTRHGSAANYDRFLAADTPAADRLGPDEAAFVAARDGFYQASVSSTGWPYVQFRGGAPGFLRVLDDRTLGYADLRGNRQHVSAGNLGADGRVSLILMDYPNRRRLKIWAEAEIADAGDAPELAAALAPEGRPFPMERAVLLHVKALDWNCPAHIPRRLTADEFGAENAALTAKARALSEENARLRRALADAR
jgi:predicted pyridoxine 5'-phosphate oxidase superfamily flavin-nucleotide-binding protein